MSDKDNELLKKYFPAEQSPPPEGTFEIALVLAGAVSAGSYTAGVMDFLIDALDTWCRRKRLDDDDRTTGTPQQKVPHHNVVLRVIAGTSAGGMNGAISAAALNGSFPPLYEERKYSVLRAANPRLPPVQAIQSNPFYKAWVESIDIVPLLATGDLKKELPPSLLNCDKLDEIVADVLNVQTGPLEPGARDWLARPYYEVRLTNTDLRGVPFAYDLKTTEKDEPESFLMHADHVAFAVLSPGATDAEARPDCVVLSQAKPRSSPEWQLLGRAGLATGAFPIALASRDLSVPGEIYKWRNAYFDGKGNIAVMANPAWPGGTPPAAFDYAAVDGGVMNNEPFELARRVLAGPRGRNAQSGKDADRAVVIVDPIIQAPKPGPKKNAGIIDVIFKLISAQMNQARLSSQDLVQIQSDDIYSRFMVAPSRKNKSGVRVFGEKALATGGLGAFFGFFSKAHRRHDYFLGRRNAQQFLRAVFTLPESNPLFQGVRWTDKNKHNFADPSAGERHLQIIPLCGHADIEETLAPWPRGAYAPRRKDVADLIKKRVTAFDRVIIRRAMHGSTGASKGGFFSRLRHSSANVVSGLGLISAWYAQKSYLLSFILETIDEESTKTDNAE